MNVATSCIFDLLHLEIKMEYSRRTTDRVNSEQDSVSDNQVSIPGLVETSQWLKGPSAVSERSTEWFTQLHKLCLNSSVSLGETLTTCFRELQEAKDLFQLLAAQSKTINSLIDIYAMQLTATQQHIVDSQILWLGQLEKTVDAPAMSEDSPMAVLEKAQDEWLHVTNIWIDSMDCANAASLTKSHAKTQAEY
jgi:hypothetical protein